MNKNDLKRVQECELGILKEILKIIEKHNLRYYMLGGTLLGAVRHHGFIPWDDDVDIGMPRPDYEKFTDIINNGLSNPYAVHSIQSGLSDFSYEWVRIVDTRLKVLCRRTAKDLILPVWVDILPLDGVPEDDEVFGKWIKEGRLLQKKIKLSQVEYFYYRGKVNKRAVLYYTGLYKLINKEKEWKKLDKHLKQYDYDSSRKIINFCAPSKYEFLFPKEAFGEGKLYPFEDLMLMGPVDSDYVLKKVYGEYMTLPPENEREHHLIELIN